MKVVLIGGHLSPALAVLQALSRNTEILFMGRKYALEGDKALSLEYKTIASLHIPFVVVNTGRLQRKLTRHTFPSLFRLPFGIAKSFFTLITFRPNVVVGFGGYVSLPVIFSAYILRIPIIIHEQTLEAGFANRIASFFAKKICISWESSRKYFPREKIVLTGNPIRNFQLSRLDSAKRATFNSQLPNKELPVIYITGGSSGSHSINLLIEGIIRELLERYVVIHQTGDAQEFHDFDRLNKLRADLPAKQQGHYILKKFVDPKEIGNLLSKVSLVISRSGMNIITELLYFEKPALLIPLPFSQNNEQLKNAKFLENIGLGKVLQQNILSSRKLFQAIDLMIRNIDNYKINDQELKKLYGKNDHFARVGARRAARQATKNIIAVINYVAKDKKTKIF